MRQEASANPSATSAKTTRLVLSRVLLRIVLPFLNACDVSLLFQTGDLQLQQTLASTVTSLSWVYPFFRERRTRSAIEVCSLPFNFIPTISGFLNLSTLVIRPLSKGSVSSFAWAPLIRLLPPSLVDLELLIHGNVLDYFLEKPFSRKTDDDEEEKDYTDEIARNASFSVFGRFPLLRRLTLGSSYSHGQVVQEQWAAIFLKSLPLELECLQFEAPAERSVLESLPPHLKKLTWSPAIVENHLQYLPSSLTSLENGDITSFYLREPAGPSQLFDLLPNLASYVGHPISLESIASAKQTLEQACITTDDEATHFDACEATQLIPRSLTTLIIKNLSLNAISALPRDLLNLRVLDNLRGDISGSNSNHDDDEYDDDQSDEESPLSIAEMMQTDAWKNSLNLSSSWPPHLRSLSLRHPPLAHIFVYSLPRTLTDINLDWLQLDARHVELLPSHLRSLKCCLKLKDEEYKLLPRSLEVLEAFRDFGRDTTSNLVEHLPRNLRLLTLDYSGGFDASIAPHLPQGLLELNLWSINLTREGEVEKELPSVAEPKRTLLPNHKEANDMITELTPKQLAQIEDCNRRITDFVEQLPDGLLLTAWFKYGAKLVRTSEYLEPLLPSFYTSDACTHRTKHPVRMRLSMF